MFSYVRADRCDCLFVKVVTFVGELVKEARQCANIMEYDEVGYEMIILDELALLISIILLQSLIAAETNPFYQIVERLTLAGSGLNGASQRRIRNILEQEDCSNHSSQFAKRLIQAILSAKCSQPSENC